MMERSVRPTGVALLALCCAAGVAGCKKDPNVQKRKYLESGERYMKDGKNREAGIQLANAIKIDPNYAAAHYDLSQVYLALGNPIAAFQELNKTVNLEPSNVTARLGMATLMVHGGEPDRAMEQVKAIFALSPNNPDAYQIEAEADAIQNRPDEALTNIRQAIQINPNNPAYHTTLAGILAQTAPTSPQVVDELNKALALDHGDVQARLAMAGVMMRRGNQPAAAEQLQQALQLTPKDTVVRGALAQFDVNIGQPQQAEQVLLDGVHLAPDDDNAASMLKDFYLLRHETQQGRQTYAALAQQYPKSVPIRVAYTQILLENGDFQDAQTLVDQLNKNNSNNPQVQLVRAYLLLHTGKLDDAYVLLNKAVQTAPNNLPLHLLLADTAIQKHDMSAALTSYQAALALEPGNLAAARGIAAIAIQSKDMAMLSQVADATLKVHPDIPDPYLWRGSVEMQASQNDAADADFQHALKLDAGSAQARTMLGELYLHEGKAGEAIDLLQQAVVANPRSGPALNALIAADLQQGNPQKGLADVQAAIARVPDDPQFYSMLALLELGLKDYPATMAAASKAMAMNPYDENAVQAYAQAQANTGQPDAAIATWAHWATAHPSDPKAIMILGTLEEQKGNTAKAGDDYRRVLELLPDNPTAANNLAMLMIETGGNTDVALNYAQVARRGMPDSPNTADTLAWAYYQKGSYPSAQGLLEDAVKQQPNNPSMHYHLGATYLKLGDKARAAEQLKQAVSLSTPDSQVNKAAAAALAQAGQ